MPIGDSAKLVEQNRSPDDAARHAAVDESTDRTHTRLTSTVKTALDVLRSFTLETPAWGVNELARHLGLHKSTISRLLATLEEERLVKREPGTEKYQLDLGLVELAGVVLNQLDLRRVALPGLRQLAATTRETVSLAVWDAGSVMLIEHLPSHEPITYLGRIGHRTPAHCSSGGKAMLAFGDPARVQEIIDAGLERYTERTISTGKELQLELKQIRRRGYSINMGEFWDGVHAVAAPIWDMSEGVVGAVAVAGPGFRLTSEQLSQIGEMAKRTADDISRQLGARDPLPGGHPD